MNISEITPPFYLRSPNPMDDFNSAMIKLVIWILLPSLIFKLTLTYLRQFEKPSLLMWVMGSHYFSLERFRRGLIYSVEILTRNLLGSFLEDFSRDSENDDDSSSVVSESPWSWMEKEDSNNNDGNVKNDDLDVFCADPPKEENPICVCGARSHRRRNAEIRAIWAAMVAAEARGVAFAAAGLHGAAAANYEAAAELGVALRALMAAPL